MSQEALSGSGGEETPPNVQAPHEQTEVLVSNLHAETAYQRLPENVFPVRAELTLDRRTRNDTTCEDIRPPEYPVEARTSEPNPYIPSQSVYFHNPAELSNQTDKTWTYDAFVESLHEAIRILETHDPSASDRLYLTKIDFVEVPEEYAYRDADGTRSVESALYEDRAEMAIGSFTKRPTLSSQKVKEKIQASAPGKVKQPLRLTQLKVVNAKEHRGTDSTTAEATKRKYFTEGQAEDYNQLQFTPSVYRLLDEVSPDNRDQYRPLTPVLDRIDDFFPKLYSGREQDEFSFMHKVKFYGHLKNNERFVEQDVVIDGGDD